MNVEKLKKKRLFLFDLDGTIYLDNILFKHSLELFDYIKSIEGKYIFLSNNSSKSTDDYIKKLSKLGLKVDRSNFMTSSQVASIYIREKHSNKNVHVIGTESFKIELLKDGINIVDKDSESIDCLLVGYDTELDYTKLYDACKILQNDVIYLATNPDLVCPTSFGFIPDCGSICEMIMTATGKKPIYLGKPDPMIIEHTLNRNKFTKAQAIFIGDRLYTDIACGINAGISTGLVLTGETKYEHLGSSRLKPDYIFEDLSQLYTTLIN